MKQTLQHPLPALEDLLLAKALNTGKQKTTHQSSHCESAWRTNGIKANRDQCEDINRAQLKTHTTV